MVDVESELIEIEAWDYELFSKEIEILGESIVSESQLNRILNSIERRELPLYIGILPAIDSYISYRLRDIKAVIRVQDSSWGAAVKDAGTTGISYEEDRRAIRNLRKLAKIAKLDRKSRVYPQKPFSRKHSLRACRKIYR